MPLIELKNIQKTFDVGDTKFHALDDVSLTVESGEFVAVMGPSGSGKSTLMNIVGLLDRPSSGTYTLEGRPVSLTMSDREQARLRGEFIGFIFQTFNLLANIDVVSNVMLPASYLPRAARSAPSSPDPSSGRRGGAPAAKNTPRARAENLLRDVGLEHRMKYKPNNLSGGERQRVAIARSLMNEPKVVLADEPIGNLDSKSGAEVVNILRDLNRRGTTLVMVTHSEELAGLAHRVIYIKDGRLV